MKASDVSAAICLAYQIRRPLMIWGPPGIGKSDMVGHAAKLIIEQLTKTSKDFVKWLAKGNKFGVADFRMALRDPTDIKGFPMPDQDTKTMKFYRDGELPTEGYGILFMDELVSATPATQAAGMQLCLPPFRIGDYQLPPGWSIVAAGNRESDRGVAHRMPTPLANRFTHLEMNADVDDWVTWALDNVSAELVAFIRFRQNLLFTFDPKVNSKAFATPRSWVATEQLVNADVSNHVKLEMIKGTVGDGPGAEYWSFREMIHDLPTLEQIRMEPEKTPVPADNKPGTRYAITTLMGANVTEANFAAFLKYSERMNKEFQVVFVKDALHKEPKLKTNKLYTSWALKNADVIC